MFQADDYPDFKPPEMNLDQKKFIDDSIAQKDKGVTSAYDRAQQELSSAKGLLPTAENVNRSEGALGRNNKAQTDAILLKGETLFSSNIRKMMLQNQMDKQKAQMNRLGEKYQLSSRQYRIFDEIRQAKILAEANKIAARNAVIGQVFQTVGMVAGAAIGGPAGAAAGSAVGGAIAPKQSAPQSGKMARNERGNAYGDFNDRMYGKGDVNG